MDPAPIILHTDMDSFFASVEERERPEIRGKPVVVGADPKGGYGRGVVSTANYEARKYGIRSGMPISRAWAICPGAVYLRPDFPLYLGVSRRVMEILGGCTLDLHQVSIDEAFLVLAPAGGYPAARETAIRIKEEIRREERLTCSIGIGPSRIVAKIASDFHKPDGLTVVPPEEVPGFLAPLPVGKIPGIGKKTGDELARMGIGTIGDLRGADVQLLQSRFGRWGPMMHELAHGRDVRGPREEGSSRSVSREITFEEDTADPAVLLGALDEMAGDLQATLGGEDLFFRTLTLKVRYTGFITKTLSRTLPRQSNSPAAIRRLARELLAEAPGGSTVRLLGIRLSGLQERGTDQRSIEEYLVPGNGGDHEAR